MSHLLIVQCGYCHAREVLLTGDEAAEYLEANDEQKPGHICPTCADTCRAHARQERAHTEWLAEGGVK